jgi:hypothetical protein
MKLKLKIGADCSGGAKTPAGRANCKTAPRRRWFGRGFHCRIYHSIFGTKLIEPGHLIAATQPGPHDNG